MLNQKWSIRSFGIYLCIALCLLTACSTKQVEAGNSETSKDYLKAAEQDMQAWREMKFGLFIHWGPVSLKGTEIGWSRGGERRGRRGKGEIPFEEYDNLYKKFNPIKFNADEWVQVAKDAGMKYLVFTSKHHDGFSMFDSKHTDYKITNSPFKRDVVKELADACHKAGLKLGYYYSPVDWYHPDYRTENHSKYIKFMHNQIRQLCTDYGKLDIMWFDGLGGSAKDWDSENLFKMIRKLQPHIIINNRAGLAADHDTPEQRIGKFQNDRAWETCMTICRQWAWKPNDQMKSLKQCIQTLVRVVGGDGNLLFNVGPMPDGRIEPRQVKRLREMGQWLKKYGQSDFPYFSSIYGTRGGPFKTGSWGASTHKGKTIYVHVFNWDGDTITLPPIPKKIIASSVLGSSGSATVKQTEEAIEISVPEAYQQKLVTIIGLKLDGPANEITPRALTSGSLAEGKKASASNVYRNMRQYSADKAVDTNTGTRQAWLEIDLGKSTTFNNVVINEEFDRVQQYELQCKDGGQWWTIADGKKIGRKHKLEFSPPVTARYVRLNILKASDGPTIWEFQLFAPKK
ncbi:MAG: alpha-L-fucosidase [Planctomycetota bacterium]